MIVVSGIEPEDGVGFEEELKALFKADGEHVDVGWFEEQGMHPSDPPRSYPEVAEYQATNVIPRDVLAIAQSLYNPGKPEVNKAVDKFLDNPTEAAVDRLLSVVGTDQVSFVKSLFGGPMLHPTPENPDPLVDIGELRDHTAYKVKNGGVKTL